MTSGEGSTSGTGGDLPSAPVLQLGFSQVKQFDFSWTGTAGAEYYQLLESAAPAEPFVQIADDIMGESISITMPLHFSFEASYVLRACNSIGCTDSATVSVVGALAEAVGYFKASNTGSSDYFGASTALSGDGSTLAVGAFLEDSVSTGIDGDQADDSATDAGAVYVFVRDGTGQWSQQAYIKATNTDAGDYFGARIALDHDGETLAVGAQHEDSNGTGIGGNQANDAAPDAGAAYVFVRNGMGQWSQQAYLKASNAQSGDIFGIDLDMSDDGDTLVVGARHEASAATGVDGDQGDNTAPHAGAVYVFVRDATDQWSQQTYLKASNTGPEDIFGYTVSLSGDGMTIAVGALYEDGSDETAQDSGAVYVFVRNRMNQWSQQAYLKASNAGSYDVFGHAIALDGDGNTLAVGAPYEDSGASGVDGNQNDESTPEAGAVYVFVRNPVGEWSQQAYLKASNSDVNDTFGIRLALDDTGNILATASPWEDGNAMGIGGNQFDDSASSAGAIYVFVRNQTDQWSQHAYLKASNTGLDDNFGVGLALSGDANTLAVGAHQEDSNATGVGGSQLDAVMDAGAVYLY